MARVKHLAWWECTLIQRSSGDVLFRLEEQENLTLQCCGALPCTPSESNLLATVHMYNLREVKIDCSPTVDPPVDDVTSETFLSPKHVTSTWLSYFQTRRIIKYTHPSVLIRSHCSARYVFRENQRGQGQVTLTEPLNRGHASRQRQTTAYIKVSIFNVRLLTKTDPTITPD